MKKLVVIVITAGLLLLPAGPVFASPLGDFSSGRWAVDLNWKPHSFAGGNAYELGVTAGLGNDWAVAGRQIDYDGAGTPGDRVRHREITLVRKLGDGLQLYAGHARTDGAAGGKNVAQLGVIAARKLSDKLTLYTILGGGRNVANVEFGLSYQLSRTLELTSTYRHLTVEKVGPAEAKQNYRGFGLGLTWKI